MPTVNSIINAEFLKHSLNLRLNTRRLLSLFAQYSAENLSAIRYEEETHL